MSNEQAKSNTASLTLVPLDPRTSNLFSRSVTLADIDNDGDIDLLDGNIGPANRLFLNNGTATTFSGSGISVGTQQNTLSIALANIDGDDDIDLLEGNYNEVNYLYLNNGTATPFASVIGIAVGTTAQNTRSIALADIDGDGDFAADWIVYLYQQGSTLGCDGTKLIPLTPPTRFCSNEALTRAGLATVIAELFGFMP